MLQRTRSFSRTDLLLLVVALLFVLPALGQRANAPNVSDDSAVTIIRQSVHHDVSLPLRDLIKTARVPNAQHQPREAEPARLIPLPSGLNTEDQTDTVHQRTAALAPASLAPTAGLGFEGLGNNSLGFVINSAPPDTNGAVGLTQYVQWVNTSFAVFNKSNGALIAGPTAGNTLWTGFGGGCQANNDGDPIVVYDKLAQRWVFSQFSVTTTPYL